MSFILDALRKSEHERQRQSAPGIADTPVSRGGARFPLWAVALGVLLVANIAVVTLLVLRNPGNAETRESPPAAAPAASTPAPVTNTPEPAAQVAAAGTAGDTQPRQSASAPTPSVAASAPVVSHDVPEEWGTARRPLAPEAAEAAAEPVDPRLRRAAIPEPEPEPEIFGTLPTAAELEAQGRSIPSLHLDIHVYAARPAERFVFINMRKYREGGETPEGAVIERITRDGVVISHHGQRFTLPRQ